MFNISLFSNDDTLIDNGIKNKYQSTGNSYNKQINYNLVGIVMNIFILNTLRRILKIFFQMNYMNLGIYPNLGKIISIRCLREKSKIQIFLP